jgi:hypothetical protein
MTLFHLHDGFAATAGESRLARACGPARLAAMLKTIHEAIVAAKTRRLQRELMFHPASGEEPVCGQDIGKIPQQPMILGDKWDF